MKKILTYLIATTALLMISAVAMAQDGENPFVGSTHTYNVTPDPAGVGTNTYSWAISGGGTINGVSNGTSLSVTWTAAGPQTVTFTETDGTGTTCFSSVQLPVTVIANDFDVNIGTLADGCNNNSGTVSPVDSANSIIAIPFEMETGGTTWSPNWEVFFDLSVTSVNARLVTVALTSGANGTLNDLGGGAYSITGINGASGVGETSIDVEVKGYSFEDVTIDAEITAAKELQYDTPAGSTGSWVPSTITIYKIPNTSPITTD
ncbi:hypothetical protein [uncultured Draconibacterium sp.]|uniref:hypothetical protein n=1 Tax=uncultured Draconibacterium sp. TaxID=1573823 RepID=UPI003216A494